MLTIIFNTLFLFFIPIQPWDPFILVLASIPLPPLLVLLFFILLPPAAFAPAIPYSIRTMEKLAAAADSLAAPAAFPSPRRHISTAAGAADSPATIADPARRIPSDPPAQAIATAMATATATAPLKLLHPGIDRRFRGTNIALALKVGARGILVFGEFSAALMGGCIQLATPVPEDGTRYGTVTCETGIGI
jgi:hypothetical protein